MWPPGSRWKVALPTLPTSPISCPAPKPLSDSGWAEWRVVQRLNVPVSQLYPCFYDTQASVMHLQIGYHLDSAVAAVLRRSIAPPLRPVCPKGHMLKEQPLN